MKNLFLLLFLFCCFQSKAQSLKDCLNCSTQIIKIDQIKGLSIGEIRLLTNEIFARNGYQFENGRIQNFFEGKFWYKSKKDNKKVVFSEIEKKNIKLFQDKTKELKNNQRELVNQLNIFKGLVLNNKKEELKTKFGFYYENKRGDNERKSLNKVLNKINLNDINYYKSKGLNSTMIDNGFVKIVYEIYIENEHVNLYYNYKSNSKIIKDVDEYTDYHSEDEYVYNWQFEFKNNKLKFIRLAVAG